MSEFSDEFDKIVEDVKRQCRERGWAEFIYSPRYPITFVKLDLTIPLESPNGDHDPEEDR